MSHDVLALWERAISVQPEVRADTILSACIDAPSESLGERNAELLSLRARLFGPVQPLRSTCARCGVAVEFSVDCDGLARDLRPTADSLMTHVIELDNYRVDFRVPSWSDVAHATARAAIGASFVDELLERCITRCEQDGNPCDPAALPDTVGEALSQRLEELEPGAIVSFDLVCPECDARWNARMNCGDVLWSEVQSRAERLLLEIDALARVYGWTETEVLSLSATRRAAYLQLASAGVA